MASSVFNPDADAESTSVDGLAEQDYGGSPQSWATLRAATGTGSSDSAITNNAPHVQAGASSNNWRRMSRAFYLFDTSSLPDTANITAATLELYVNSKQGASVSYVVIETNPASNTAVASGDYDAVTLADLSDEIASGDITTSAYNTWTLNATGLTKISKTGITKLGMTFVEDVDNSQPTWSSEQETSIIVQTAEGTNAPKLTVTYDVPGVSPSASLSPSSSASASLSPSASVSPSASSSASLSPSSSISPSSSRSPSSSASASASPSSSASPSLSPSASVSPSASYSASPSGIFYNTRVQLATNTSSRVPLSNVGVDD